MKTISSELEQHLRQHSTTIATLIKITRTDAVTYTFTDFNKDIIYSSTLYRASNSFIPTEYTTTLGLSPDTIELTGLVRAEEETYYIKEQDILNNKLFGAKIEIFMINYLDHTMGPLSLTSGWLGEVKLTDKKYILELRGKTAKYETKLAQLFSKTCRADFGDSKCGITIEPSDWLASTAYSVGDIVKATTYDGRRYVCSTAGTSNSSEPTWNTTLDATTNDNTVVWTTKDAFKKYSTVAGIPIKVKFYGAIGSSAARVTEVFTYNTSDTPVLPSSVTDAVSISNAIRIGDGSTASYASVTGSIGTPSEATLNYASFFELGKIGLAVQAYTTTYLERFWFTISVDGGTTWKPLYYSDTGLTYNWWQSQLGGSIGTLIIPSSEFLTDVSGGGFYKVSLPDPLFNDTSYFNDGLVEWLTGNNAGDKNEVLYYDSVTQALNLLIPTNYPIVVGDTFSVEAGCNKLFLGSDGTTATGNCVGRYNNGVNFRGEPYIPTEDVLVGGIGETNKEPEYYD